MDFVSFEIAKKLKEKGFKEICLAYYTNDNTLYYNFSHKAGACCIDCLLSHNLMPKDSVSGKFVDAPTISQVLKWLREEKKIHISIDIWGRTWGYDILNLPSGSSLHWTAYEENINNYEQAALAGIEYVLENLI